MSGTPDRESVPSNGDDSSLEGNKLNSPAPAPRVSLPIRYANPIDANSERSVNDICPDTIFVRNGTSVTETIDLIHNVSTTLEEVDHFVEITQNILDQTTESK